ncbi:uncharacterized protein MONBRDRAFT_22187 [Monosiga brevicollis MX1]|uniref:alpha-L-rhamnosidase n=1 Tax=Monosiga brevicollis TaxID=81824 RepID=A9UPT8_MONBE|nr:uncharacterized protein MONBRDRAFT_22187 [Monosiga brevicollis MX1]EDQ92931.1 predicted protein [Monosiga brevicollis MX1]|eukprot:XP_001742693.1 hypothetical protein [Monosiga brevicollis MX1]
MPRVVKGKPLAVVGFTSPQAHSYVWELEANVGGRCELAIPDGAVAGSVFALTHGESLDPATGQVIQSPATPDRHTNQRIVEATRYTAGGHTGETFRPHLVYYGFKYVQVNTAASGLTTSSLRCWPVHTNLSTIATLDVQASDAAETEAAQSVYAAMVRTALSNFHDVPTDCPTREKRGWTGDMSAAHQALLHTFDMAQVYPKWLTDVADAQAHHGLPQGWYDRVDVGTALLNNVLAYVDHLESYATPLPTPYPNVSTLRANYPGSRYGDWCAYPELNNGVHAYVSSMGNSFFHLETLSAAAELAAWANHSRASALSTRAAELHAAFHATYFNATLNAYMDPFWNNSNFINQPNGRLPVQTAQTLGIAARPPRDQGLAALQALVNDIEAFQYRPTGGVVGTSRLFQALGWGNRSDVAWELLVNRAPPSWANMSLTTGSLWENWDGSGSRNHIMFGGFGAWYIQSLAGLQQAPGDRGWQRCRVAAAYLTKVTSVNATLLVPTGVFRSQWTATAPGTVMHTVAVPSGATADLELSLAQRGQRVVQVWLGTTCVWCNETFVPAGGLVNGWRDLFGTVTLSTQPSFKGTLRISSTITA